MSIKAKAFWLAMVLVGLPVLGKTEDAAKSENTSKSSSDSSVAQQLEGFNLNGYAEDGKKSWEINGAKADINDEKINNR